MRDRVAGTAKTRIPIYPAPLSQLSLPVANISNNKMAQFQVLQEL